MRRAFVLAGARVVIASEWAVEDAATHDWMDALHGALRAVRAPRRRCARPTRPCCARRAAHRSTHLFYWAAFGASGE